MYDLRIELPGGQFRDICVQGSDLKTTQQNASQQIEAITGTPPRFIDWRGAIGFVDCRPAEEMGR